MNLPTPEEHEYQSYREHKKQGLDSAEASKRSSRSSKDLVMAYALTFKMIVLVTLGAGFVIICLPLADSWSTQTRGLVLVGPLLVVALASIALPIKARNKGFWILYSAALALIIGYLIATLS